MLKYALIVDDSPTIRKLITFGLKKFEGCVCVEAGDGVEALQQLSDHECDIILTDINMPDMNGLEFIQNIRKHPNYSETPIIVITTEGREDSLKQAMEAGANEYIIKPFQPPALQSVIEKVLQSKES
jgi:two-component system chemotaxis response regulator CheY